LSGRTVSQYVEIHLIVNKIMFGIPKTFETVNQYAIDRRRTYIRHERRRRCKTNATEEYYYYYYIKRITFVYLRVKAKLHAIKKFYILDRTYEYKPISHDV
jgi:hypothetical protein